MFRRLQASSVVILPSRPPPPRMRLFWVKWGHPERHPSRVYPHAVPETTGGEAAARPSNWKTQLGQPMMALTRSLPRLAGGAG